MKPKNTICLWFDKDAHEAARFYAATFPNSQVTAVREAPADYPSGKKGDVLVVEFTVLGIPCLGLNGGPTFRLNEAFSLMVSCETQAEIDELWSKLSAGGQPGRCGWLKDRFGLSWQVIPTVLLEMLQDEDPARAQRVRAAMMEMDKIDIRGLQRAHDGH